MHFAHKKIINEFILFQDIWKRRQEKKPKKEEEEEEVEEEVEEKEDIVGEDFSKNPRAFSYLQDAGRIADEVLKYTIM